MDTRTFSAELVRDAGKHILAVRQGEVNVSTKNDDPRDIVTNVDIQVHELISRRIQETFPADHIYSEEDKTTARSGRMWTIDPIDGSSNFSRGIPHFAVCVGLLEDGVPVSGAIYNPTTDELYSFGRGSGAFLNSTPIHVSPIMDLASAFVLFHAGRKEAVRDWGGESYRRLLGAAKKTSNLASSSLDTCFVASGKVEVNIYGTLSTLDIAPAIGLLREAGGVIVSSGGQELRLSEEPQRIYMANNQTVLDAVMTLLES